MALTAAGRALTEQHRRRQLSIASQGQIVAHALWPMLDPQRIGATRNDWLAANVLAARRSYEQSVAASAQYIAAYAAAEAVSIPTVVPAPFDVVEATTILEVAGPVQFLGRVRDGDDVPMALAGAYSQLTMQQRRLTLMGGRNTIAGTADRDRRAVGWRRVTDGDPCAFCAMLATRGVIGQGTLYSSGATAGDEAYGGSEYHKKCGCTAEIVYGEWIPNALEERFIQDYLAAAEAADLEQGRRVAPNWRNREDTILYRMRQMGYR